MAQTRTQIILKLIIQYYHNGAPTSIFTKDSVEIDYEALPDDASLAAFLTAGALAGIMEHTVMFPIDSIKTRMQMNLSNSVSRGLLKSLSKISSTEGFMHCGKGCLLWYWARVSPCYIFFSI